ncbi:hypothetical protein [uncultured Tenacibaculum sp.]|uniref:hypothetical protein n=1 Tax=uncultured Tenacibaculum sp. TaxID=174713 RepID=UPI00260E0DE4|nr:hypothetical protein [uncultured Tenacibaculum sp.]
MRKINFKKDHISIQNIGKLRFWIGIISGFVTATTLSLIFNRAREIIRFSTSISEDLLTFEDAELAFFNYFIVSLCTALGLSVTIRIWVESTISKKKKHNFLKQQIRTNTVLFFWIILFLAVKLAYLFIFLIAAEVSSNSGHPINLYKDCSSLFVLLPIVIFINSWSLLRLLYKSIKWILISIVVSFFTILILYRTTTVNQEILNDIYFKPYLKSLEYIDNEIKTSEKKYNIKFDSDAIRTLKKRKYVSSGHQIWDIKKSFSYNQKVSLDTIIIQQIIIHDLKGSYNRRYYYKPRSVMNWKYALPKDILKQIGYFNPNSNETKELFNLLKEEILLVNRSKIILDKELEYEPRDQKRKELQVNVMLVEQLKEVKDSLLAQKKYVKLHNILPEIKEYSLEEIEPNEKSQD